MAGLQETLCPNLNFWLRWTSRGRRGMGCQLNHHHFGKREGGNRTAEADFFSPTYLLPPPHLPPQWIPPTAHRRRKEQTPVVGSGQGRDFRQRLQKYLSKLRDLVMRHQTVFPTRSGARSGIFMCFVISPFFCRRGGHIDEKRGGELGGGGGGSGP